MKHFLDHFISKFDALVYKDTAFSSHLPILKVKDGFFQSIHITYGL
jgi:hypothetical protein